MDMLLAHAKSCSKVNSCKTAMNETLSEKHSFREVPGEAQSENLLHITAFQNKIHKAFLKQIKITKTDTHRYFYPCYCPVCGVIVLC